VPIVSQDVVIFSVGRVIKCTTLLFANGVFNTVFVHLFVMGYDPVLGVVTVTKVT